MEPPEQTPVAPHEFEAYASVARQVAANIARAVQIRAETLEQLLIARIEGEAGIGYVLRPGFFVPPLMFNAEELEALVLGARWVQSRPDEGLSGAARNALGKIATASPDDLRDRIRNTALWGAIGRTWR